MLGSQALETAIGLTLLVFIVALAVSAATETVSRMTGKRGKALKEVIGHMIGSITPDGITVNDALWDRFAQTSVYRSAVAASGRSLFLTPKDPSYLSAKSFADAVVEMAGIRPGALTEARLDELGPAGQRVKALVDGLGGNVHPGDQMTEIKAGLERWYDETMDRMEGAYKRWVTLWVFILGLGIAVVANASTYHVAERLWQDPTTREAVVAAAGRTVADPPTSADLGADIESVADTTDRLTELGLPVGWDDAAHDAWAGGPFSVHAFGYVLGWLTTAGLATLGAPFWFDLLTRLVSLREAGSRPKAAADDPGSATTALNRRTG